MDRSNSGNSSSNDNDNDDGDDDDNNIQTEKKNKCSARSCLEPTLRHIHFISTSSVLFLHVSCLVTTQILGLINSFVV